MQPEVTEGFRLSPQQKHLWSLQLADGSLPYRAQCSILIEGSLDVQVLEGALQRVFERHEILRTYFQSAPGANAPVQVVSAEGMARIDKSDLSDCDRAQQAESIDRLYREMGDLAFDLGKGSLVRMSLLRLSPDRHVSWTLPPELTKISPVCPSVLPSTVSPSISKTPGIAEICVVKLSNWLPETELPR